MFSGRFDTKPGEDGSYFIIDRDGTHFRHILNYLRTGKLVLPDDKVVRKELLSEAEFYQIDGILDELKANPFKDSAILSSEQRETLVDWLKDTRESLGDDYVLLYRASRNGWAASNFHSCCDNKGPTVTVIKSGNYIFGGYTEQPWQSSSKRPFCQPHWIKLHYSPPPPPLMIKYPILIFCSQIYCLLSIYKLITEARSLMLVNFYLFLLFILGKCNDDFAKIQKRLKSIRKWYLYNRSSSTKNSQMRASWHTAQTSS